MNILKKALYVLAAGIALSSQNAHAAGNIPVPVPKPDLSREASVSISLPNILDFTRNLLDFGQPPIPKKKPAALLPVLSAEDLVLNEQPISEKNAETYKRIFALQDDGDIRQANQEIARLTDYRLYGHVLYQRYMHPKAYTSAFNELRAWLDLYADHPGAHKIYALAQKRKPSSFSGQLTRPASARSIARVSDPNRYEGRIYRSQRQRTAGKKQEIDDLKRSVGELSRAGKASAAYQKLSGAAEMLDHVEYDLLQSYIAASYLHHGDTAKAFELASASVKRSGLHVPLAGWTAALISWQRGYYQQAARFFEVTARSPYASGWTASAGAYWAARAHMRVGNVRAVSTWLKRGTEHPRTFYGLLSTRALGRNFDFNWAVPTFTGDYYDLLASLPAGNRAMALVETGQMQKAEIELLRINAGDKTVRDALLAYANYANLPGLAMRLGSAVSDPEGAYYDAALYPTAPWQPKEGYRIDPALIYAITRQESRFDPVAVSPKGARGLMQIMPATARGISSGNIKGQLADPEINLALGQQYLETLLKDPYVENDLIHLMIAYNAGPGNLSRWKKRWPDVEDSLLFIELIPSAETRAYVERVLSNYWIYRLREGLETPTLDALAAGKKAEYASTGNFDLAEN